MATIGQKKAHHFDGLSTVQVGRLELPSLAALVPETSVSTNSTTPAWGVQKYKTGGKCSNFLWMHPQYFCRTGKNGLALLPQAADVSRPVCCLFENPVGDGPDFGEKNIRDILIRIGLVRTLRT